MTVQKRIEKAVDALADEYAHAECMVLSIPKPIPKKQLRGKQVRIEINVLVEPVDNFIIKQLTINNPL